MPTRERPVTRAPEDRMIDLHDASNRVGFAAESLRKMMFRESEADRPPFHKIHGRWRIWISDLDAWAASRVAAGERP